MREKEKCGLEEQRGEKDGEKERTTRGDECDAVKRRYSQRGRRKKKKEKNKKKSKKNETGRAHARIPVTHCSRS